MSQDGGGRWDAARFAREREERVEPLPGRRGQQRRSAMYAEPEGKRRSFVDDYVRSQAKYHPPARRADRDYEDERFLGHSEALVPYEQRSERSPSPERPPERAPPSRAPPRPTLLRRQSSLDTFDRAATRRANDLYRYDREDYGPPVTPVASRRRAPSRVREHESEIESSRGPESDSYADERIEKLRRPTRSLTPRGRESPRREEVVRERADSRLAPKRGQTRVPRRFVHPRAMIDLGYSYEDEGETYLISKALAREHIDELFALSKAIQEETEGTTRNVRETQTTTIGARESDLALERSRSRSQSTRRVSHAATDRRRVYSPSPSPSPRARIARRQRRRSSPVPLRPDADDVIEPRADMAMILPDRRRRRSHDRRDDEYLEPDETVETRRDYKDPSPRMIRAMMAALT